VRANIVALVFLLLLPACGLNPRVSAPQYELAKTRATAARFLNEALGEGGTGISEINADETTLRWHENRQLTDQRRILVPRELVLQRVSHVNRPDHDSMGWRLSVDAAGGRVTFAFRDSRNAFKAESAFKRLMRDD